MFMVHLNIYDNVMRTRNSYAEDNMRVNGDSGRIEFEKPTLQNPF